MTIDAFAERLTPFEDGQLRRLFFFESTGAALSPAMRVLKAELRARDRRTVVRDPELTVKRVPDYG